MGQRGQLTLDRAGEQRVLDLERDQRGPTLSSAVVWACAVTQAGVLEKPM